MVLSSCSLPRGARKRGVSRHAQRHVRSLPVRVRVRVRVRVGVCPLRHRIAREFPLEDDACGHAKRGGDVVVHDANDVNQIGPRFGRTHARHDALSLRCGEERRRQGWGDMCRDGRRGAASARTPAHVVGRLHPVDRRHQARLHCERAGLRRVVFGRGRRLHCARLAVEKQVGRIEVVVVRRALHRLRHKQLPSAHNLRLQRQLLQRRNERSALKACRSRATDVARVVRWRFDK